MSSMQEISQESCTKEDKTQGSGKSLLINEAVHLGETETNARGYGFRELTDGPDTGPVYAGEQPDQ